MDSDFNGVDELRAAAIFMSLHCPDSLKDYEFCGSGHSLEESFAALLVKAPYIHEALKTSHKNKEFTSFWGLCEQCTADLSGKLFGASTIVSEISVLGLPKDISAGTAKLLGEIRPNLLMLVKGDVALPAWSEPDPAEAVAEKKRRQMMKEDEAAGEEVTVPSTANDSASLDMRTHLDSLRLSATRAMPLMEVHDLGGFKTVPLLNKRVNELFDGSNTFLVNVSGSGKTRLLYEGLCQNWGFFFTADVDKSHLGSKDIQSAWTDIDNNLNPLFPSDAPAHEPLLAMNIMQTTRYFSEVLLARLLVFRLFLEIARELGEGLIEAHKRRWLIAQLCPLHLYHSDIFSIFASYFRYAEYSYVKDTLKETLVDIRTMWSALSESPPHLSIVLDEANVLSRKELISFRDEFGEYPILREILRVWRTALDGFAATFVVAGIDIPKKYFVRDPWTKTFKWSSDTGAFLDYESHRQYVVRFLPPGMADTPSGQALLSRIWSWCRGRHRVTALLVAVLLKNWFRSPHKLFLDYISSLAEYKVADEDGLAEREEKSNWTTSLRYGAYKTLFRILSSDVNMRAAVHEVLFHYLITCEHPRYFDEDLTGIVSHGIGRFVSPDMREIAVDEPLFLATAALWFYAERRSLTNFQDFVKLFQCPSTRPYNPVGYICTYLSLALDGKRPLSALLKFPRDDVPSWATKPPQLVRLYTESDGEVHHEPVHTLDMFSGPTLGFNARTRNDLHTWLTSASGAPFCVCSTSCNADLIFVLELSNHKLIWVVLRTSGSGTADVVTPEELQESLDSLLPINLFPAQEDDAEGSENTPTPDELLSAFTRLPNRFKTLGQHSILRVDASFPETTDFRGFEQRSKDKELCAALETSLIEEITAAIPSSEMIDGIVASFMGKRPSNYDNPPSVTPRRAKRRRSADP